MTEKPIPEWAWTAAAGHIRDAGAEVHPELLALLLVETREKALREAMFAIRHNDSGTYKVADLEAVEALIDKEPAS